MLAKGDLLYAAGLFDGEGGITIVKQAGNTYRLDVRITSTNKAVLRWYKARFGGWVCKQTPNKHVKWCLPCWYWAASSKMATAFLAKVYPYLRVKRKQAKLALEFQKQCIKPRGAHYLGAKAVKARVAFKRQLSTANATQPVGFRRGAKQLRRPQYMAGLLDGEGCIGKRTVYVTNTDMSMLRELKATFGGSIGQSDGSPHRNHPCRNWRLSGLASRKFLRTLLPYLIIKKRKVQTALNRRGVAPVAV